MHDLTVISGSVDTNRAANVNDTSVSGIIGGNVNRAGPGVGTSPLVAPLGLSTIEHPLTTIPCLRNCNAQ
jgi:hypothetical protein